MGEQQEGVPGSSPPLPVRPTGLTRRPTPSSSSVHVIGPRSTTPTRASTTNDRPLTKSRRRARPKRDGPDRGGGAGLRSRRQCTGPEGVGARAAPRGRGGVGKGREGRTRSKLHLERFSSGPHVTLPPWQGARGLSGRVGGVGRHWLTSRGRERRPVPSAPPRLMLTGPRAALDIRSRAGLGALLPLLGKGARPTRRVSETFVGSPARDEEWESWAPR